MNFVGMDVHRSFAQVAIHEDGITAKSFRLELEHDTAVAFGKGLRADDEVVLEVTGNTAAIVRLLTRRRPSRHNLRLPVQSGFRCERSQRQQTARRAELL